jgi:hypothetical protein
MEPFETSTHSFIIKIWREWTGTQPGHATWRGYITHVPSGERHALHDLRDIIMFIKPYLEQMGVQQRQYQWICGWLEQARTRRKTRG